jgi:DNA-binding NarL/FixJ family response regulator
MDIPRRVLLVEDEPLLRELLAEMLVREGFETHTAANTVDARRVAEEIDPDVALLDIELGPGPNGLDLANILEQLYPGVAIVFLTHLPEPGLIGFPTANLPKSFAYIDKSRITNSHTLVEAIESALRDEVPLKHQDHLTAEHPFADLSKSQIQVLKLLASGLSVAQIAELRGTTARAVRNVIARAILACGITATDESQSRALVVREYIRYAGIQSTAA